VKEAWSCPGGFDRHARALRRHLPIDTGCGIARYLVLTFMLVASRRPFSSRYLSSTSEPA